MKIRLPIRPYYEQESDRVAERQIAELARERWDIDQVYQTKKNSPIDAVFEDKGVVISLAEVKVRRWKFEGPFGGYDSCWVEAEKIIKAIHLSDAMGLPCALIVGFKDGVWFCNVNKYERVGDGRPRVEWGGRDDRGDPSDHAPMFCFAWSAFTNLNEE